MTRLSGSYITPVKCFPETLKEDEWIQQYLLNKALNDYNCYAAAREKTGFERGRQQGERIGREQGERIGREQGERIGREQGERIGREQGEKAGIYKTAKNLKELGIDVGTIQKATGLSAEEIASL